MELVITTSGTMLKQRDGIFLLVAGDKRKEIAPSRLSRIVLSSSCSLTTQAAILAQDNNIDLVVLDKFGDPVGRFWHSKLGRVAAVRRRQLEASESETGLKIALEMVMSKLNNQVAFLKMLAQKRESMKDELTAGAEHIEKSRNEMGKIKQGSIIQDLRNQIMGLEGTAGRIYFEKLSLIMPQPFKFQGRSRRPAKDSFNATLNYCLGILYSRVEHACILAGLDPFVGFLHADSYGQTSLVFDLIEPFRIYAEKSAVFLFTGRHMKTEHFDTKDTGVSLNDSGKPVVVSALNDHLDKKIRYRRRTLRRSNVIKQEAHRIAALMMDGTPNSEPVEVEEF